MTVAVLLPAILLIAFILGVLSPLGARRRTTKVSSSTRHVKGRQRADGRWQRGSKTNVRAHTRRLSGYERSLFGELSAAGGISLSVLALAFAATPVLIWRVRVTPAGNAAGLIH